MPAESINTHEAVFDGGKLRYIEAGPENGPLIIFVHGWIAVAETWKPQILALSSLGFRVVAFDTRGYGGSVATKNVVDYALERHVADMLALISHLGRNQAVWIGHDWGCGLVWALTAHHPEVCVAVACMAVPYRTLELGLDTLVSLVNREIYPVDQYPAGQWDYQFFHIEKPERCAAVFDRDPENTIKVLYSKGRNSPETYGKPSPLSGLRKAGGWFGIADSAPQIDIQDTLLKDDQDIFEKLRDTIKKNGTFGPNAYYRNHEINKAYAQKPANGGVLDMPVLFLNGKYDSVCDNSLSHLSEPMREFCPDLTELTLNTGHWIALEKPRETNAAIVKWLVTKAPSYWPGN
jgi:soluble epoxide hydrolase/lipid-phosphate phosphatase